MIQSVVPYMSSEEIVKGARWSSSISGELESSNFGLICLTPENTDSPWLHFEAGALSKVVNNSSVAPLLFELKPSDVQGPLAQFQLTNLDREDVTKLLKSINSACLEDALEESRLVKVIDYGWDDFIEKIKSIPDGVERKKEENSFGSSNIGSILEEILVLSRQNIVSVEPLRALTSQMADQISELRHRSRIGSGEQIAPSHPVWEDLGNSFANLSVALRNASAELFSESALSGGPEGRLMRDAWSTVNQAADELRRPISYLLEYSQYQTSKSNRISRVPRTILRRERSDDGNIESPM